MYWSYSYELEKLRLAMIEYKIQFQNILGRALRISYVIRTRELCSYELKQLTSSDDVKSDSNIYWVLLQCTDMSIG